MSLQSHMLQSFLTLTRQKGSPGLISFPLCRSHSASSLLFIFPSFPIYIHIFSHQDFFPTQRKQNCRPPLAAQKHEQHSQTTQQQAGFLPCLSSHPLSLNRNQIALKYNRCFFLTSTFKCSVVLFKMYIHISVPKNVLLALLENLP